MTKGIPKEDQEVINEALRKKGPVDTITKGARGNLLKAAKVVDDRTTVMIRDFRGRALKHDKWVIPKGGKQTLVASKGTLYENVPPERKALVSWGEADFV